MKQAIFFLAFLLTGTLASAQSLTFTNDAINWNDEALILQSRIGKSSAYVYIQVENRTSYSVTAILHTHSNLNFVWFTNSSGQHKNGVTIGLGPKESVRLPVFVYLKNGVSKVYNDELGFEIYYDKHKVGYVEMDLTAYFYSSSRGGGRRTTGRATRPPGYEAWTPVGNTPMRPRVSDLPLKVYSNHASYTSSADFGRTVRRAVNLWNAAGQSIGLERNIFELTNSAYNADFGIDWSGRGLPANALGVAKIAGCNASRCYIEGIVMRPPSGHNQGQTAEILCQELAHLLGLGHSDSRDDIMNGTAHGHWHDLSEVDLTDRDRQMLQWLFSLRNFVPLVPK